MSWMDWPEENEEVWETGCTLSDFVSGSVEEVLAGAWGCEPGSDGEIKCNIFYPAWWDESLVPEPTAFKVKGRVHKSKLFDDAVEIVLEATEGEEWTLLFGEIQKAVVGSGKYDPEAKLVFMLPVSGQDTLIPMFTADGVQHESGTGTWKIDFEAYDMYMEAL